MRTVGIVTIQCLDGVIYAQMKSSKLFHVDLPLDRVYKFISWLSDNHPKHLFGLDPADARYIYSVLFRSFKDVISASLEASGLMAPDMSTMVYMLTMYVNTKEYQETQLCENTKQYLEFSTDLCAVGISLCIGTETLVVSRRTAQKSSLVQDILEFDPTVGTLDVPIQLPDIFTIDELSILFRYLDVGLMIEKSRLADWLGIRKEYVV